MPRAIINKSINNSTPSKKRRTNWVLKTAKPTSPLQNIQLSENNEKHFEYRMTIIRQHRQAMTFKSHTAKQQPTTPLAKTTNE